MNLFYFNYVIRCLYWRWFHYIFIQLLFIGLKMTDKKPSVPAPSKPITSDRSGIVTNNNGNKPKTKGK